MTPFDVTYAQEFLIQQEFASAPQHQVAQPPAPRAATAAEIAGLFVAAPAPVVARTYPLLEATTRAQMLADAPRPRSMQTPSYTEFLLQILDRDSALTSLMFIGAYIGLMQSL